MKLSQFILYFSFTVIQPLYSAFELKPTTTLQIGSGNRSLTLSSNSINIFNDPSSILNGKTFQLQAYSKTAFNFSELKFNHWSAHSNSGYWAWGIGGSKFGNKLYNESALSFVAGKRFFEKVNFGLNLTWYSLNITRYGSAQTPGLTISWHFPISEGWTWGTSLRNINAPKIGKSDELLPQVVATNLTGNFENKIYLYMEWEQDLTVSSTFRMGASWKPNPFLQTATGFESGTGTPTFGIILQSRYGTIEYGLQYFPLLQRYTSQAGIHFYPDQFLPD